MAQPMDEAELDRFAAQFFNVSWNQQKFYAVFNKAKLPTEQLTDLINFAKRHYLYAFPIGKDRLVSDGDMGYWDVDPTTVKMAFQYMLAAAMVEENRRTRNLAWEEINKEISKAIRELRGQCSATPKGVSQKEAEKRKKEKRPSTADEGRFSAPKKTCKANKEIEPLPVEVSNSFQSLPQEESMLIDNPENKVKRPPPIVVQVESGMQEIIAMITQVNGEAMPVKCYGKELTLRATDPDKHEKIKKFLVEKGMQFHSYTPRSERPVKVVVKGLPTELDTKEVQEMFSLCGLITTTVTRLYKPVEGKTPPPFVATPANPQDVEKFLRSKRITNFIIKVEKLRRRRSGKLICYKCQRVGHSSHVCHRAVACRNCGESHDTKECSNNNIRCARCKGAHKATDPACPLLKPKNQPKEVKSALPGGVKQKKSYAAAAKSHLEETKPPAAERQRAVPQPQGTLISEMLGSINQRRARAFLDAYDLFKSPPPGADLMEVKMDALAAMLRLAEP